MRRQRQPRTASLEKGAVVVPTVGRQEDGHPQARPEDELPQSPPEEEHPMTGGQKFIIYGTLAAIAGASTGLLIWILQSNPKYNTLKYEAGKTCMQVLGVVLVGFVVSYVTFTLQRNRQRQEEQADLRKDQKSKKWQREIEEAQDARRRKDKLLRSTLDETLVAYHTVKGTRRILRARIWAQADGLHIDADVYDQQMALINDVQLQFEELKRTAPLIKVERVIKEKLGEYFEVVEKHLGELVTEYESKRRRAAHIQGGISISNMPKLEEFLGPSYTGPFRDNIISPINGILSALQEALLEPLELPEPTATEYINRIVTGVQPALVTPISTYDGASSTS